MSEKDFARSISGTDSQFGRNVSNWLEKKRVYPHNVIVFEKERYFKPSTLIHLPTVCSNRNHSAAFPIELPIWFIKLFTKKGDVIIDPFVGVGTTAMASIMLGRKFIGIDSSKEYVLEARKNIKELKKIASAKKPRKARTS